jgi:hypothetical protein
VMRSRVKTNDHAKGPLLALFAVGILVIGLLALIGAKPAWAASRTFEPAPSSPLAVGSTPTTVEKADFDGDGKTDLAAQNYGSNSVSVRLGNDDGTKATLNSYVTSTTLLARGTRYKAVVTRETKDVAGKRPGQHPHLDVHNRELTTRGPGPLCFGPCSSSLRFLDSALGRTFRRTV